MRKAFQNFGSNGGGLLAPFVREGLGGGLSDAREKAVPVMAKVGHPNGMVNVPGKKGWYYAQRPDPSGLLGSSGVVIQFYAANDEDGNPKAEFVKDQSVILRQTNDTQPTYYMLVGDVSDSYQSGSLSFDPCVANGFGIIRPTELDTATALASGQYWPKKSDPVQNPSTMPNWPFRHQGVKPDKASAKNRVEPKLSKQPPSYPTVGQRWQDETSDGTYRRAGQDTTGKWEPVSGPTSGTFVSRMVLSAVTPGKVLYEVLSSSIGDYADLADNTNLACQGKVIGLAVETRSANEFCLIQQSGDLVVSNTFVENTILYLGTSGNLTTTPPAAGSAHLLQQIAVAINRYGPTPGYRIELGPCIKRR